MKKYNLTKLKFIDDGSSDHYTGQKITRLQFKGTGLYKSCIILADITYLGKLTPGKTYNLILEESQR